MPVARVTTAGRYLAVVCIVSLTSSLAQVEGRKCVCTSRPCREMGVDSCSTKFSCYTEFILTAIQGVGESTTTKGCTESATPLLCETKSWAMKSRSINNVEPSASPWLRVPWPRLKCCDSHDYCNADDGSNASTWTSERRKLMDPARSALGSLGTPENEVSTSRDTVPRMIQQDDRQLEDSAELTTGDRLLRNRVKALHVAALVLAVAALISVLASCYVVTRFLRSNRYTMNSVN